MDFRGTAASHDDRRREPRSACDRPIDILPCVAQDQWCFEQVRLTDCSPHGLGLIAKRPMVPGEQFAAKLKLERMTLVLYTVRHCQALPTQPGYKIGAEFSGFIGTPDDCDPDRIFKTLMDAATDVGTGCFSSSPAEEPNP